MLAPCRMLRHLNLCSLVQGEDEAAKEACRQALYTALEGGLLLLHPFMPFITEELWQRLPRRPDSTSITVMLENYPTSESCAAFDSGDSVLADKIGRASCRERVLLMV